MVNRIKSIQESDRLVRSPAYYDIPAVLRKERANRAFHVRIWDAVKNRFK